MTAKHAPSGQEYGIGAVARLTGLTDHTIRVWERRYQAVVARRAPNGRRVYTPQDIEKLALLKRLTDSGLSIGQIAGLGMQELEQRAADLSNVATSTVPSSVAVAILGDLLPTRFYAEDADIAPLEIAISDSSEDRFEADLVRHAVDVVIIESPVLDPATIERLKRYMKTCGAARGVLVYGFGRSTDVDRVRGTSIVAIRAPVTVDEVRAAVVRAYTPEAPRGGGQARSSVEATEWMFAGPVAPRRFNQQQLATLSSATTSIECECPHHLAQLVTDLNAFEVYSANCANRDDEDAALHGYLHRTTAEARALIEAALERVASAEGIDY